MKCIMSTTFSQRNEDLTVFSMKGTRILGASSKRPKLLLFGENFDRWVCVTKDEEIVGGGEEFEFSRFRELEIASSCDLFVLGPHSRCCGGEQWEEWEMWLEEWKKG